VNHQAGFAVLACLKQGPLCKNHCDKQFKVNISANNTKTPPFQLVTPIFNNEAELVVHPCIAHRKGPRIIATGDKLWNLMRVKNGQETDPKTKA
jgi:hypothetical protein